MVTRRNKLVKIPSWIVSMPSSVVSSWSGVGTLFLMTKMVDDGSSPKISSSTSVPSSVRISTSEFNSSFSFPDVNKIQWILLNVACLHLYLNILCFFIRVSNLLLKIVTSFFNISLPAKY